MAYELCASFATHNQLSLYLKLSLGLAKQNAVRAFRSVHDLVQLALKKEFQRLGLSVVENDADLRAHCSQPSSIKRADLDIVLSSDCDTDYQVYDLIRRRSRTQAIANINLVFLRNS